MRVLELLIDRLRECARDQVRARDRRPDDYRECAGADRLTRKLRRIDASFRDDRDGYGADELLDELRLESRNLRRVAGVAAEEHVGTQMREKATGKSGVELMAATFPIRSAWDVIASICILRRAGRITSNVSSLPFQIPLGALIPKRIENLLPACKNIGTTHITNGCYRLHPVEWGIGEAAEALAAYAVSTKQSPRAVRNNPKSLAAFQTHLRQQGFELEWPRIHAV